ncbi:MAG: hypothetical protein K0R55_243 [Sporomusa sp.]|nr:hypothetical protein [Sporomusa sp.]
MPDKCPVCSNGIKPLFCYASAHNKGNFLQIIWQCPLNECQKLFIATQSRGNMIPSLIPKTIQKRTFDQEIIDVSPNFITIYNQAENAEITSLNQICGPGYRKALEFLIKDYLVKTKPDEAESIEGFQLMPCINSFIDNTNIKECAKRAVWIGNDETHYRRKWEDKDITDLKTIIDLTLYWIISEIKTQQLLADMPKGK